MFAFIRLEGGKGEDVDVDGGLCLCIFILTYYHPPTAREDRSFNALFFSFRCFFLFFLALVFVDVVE